MEVVYFKIPIFVEDSTNKYHLFDILLPKIFDENIILSILNFLSKIRSLLYNKKDLNVITQSIFDSLSYYYFNFLYIIENIEIEELNEGIKWIILGNKKISLNNQEKSDFYYNSILCMELMNYYK